VNPKEKEIVKLVIHDSIPWGITVSVFGGVFGIVAALLFVEVPASSMQPIMLILGSLTTIMIMIAAFHFKRDKKQ